MRWPVGIFLIMHGLGHTMGFLAAWTRLDVGFTDESWILPGEVHVRDHVGQAWGMLWLVALVGWVVSGVGVIQGAEWWPAVAKGSAVVPIVAMPTASEDRRLGLG